MFAPKVSGPQVSSGTSERGRSNRASQAWGVQARLPASPTAAQELPSTLKALLHSPGPLQLPAVRPNGAAAPGPVRFAQAGADLQEQQSQALQHGLDPYTLPPKSDPLQPLWDAARQQPGAFAGPAPEPTLPGDRAQQRRVIPHVDAHALFEQAAIQARLQAAASDAEAREAAKPGGKVTHSAKALMGYWKDRFVDSVEYIVESRGKNSKSTMRQKLVQRLADQEQKLIKANHPDLLQQVESLRASIAAEWQSAMQLAADRFVLIAENEAKFITIHQKAAGVRVWGLPDWMEPTSARSDHSHVIQTGKDAADVAQSVVTFMEAVHQQSGVKAKAENYPRHEFANLWLGGDPKHMGKYSFDVHLDSDRFPVSDGFYDRAALVDYFLAVDRAAQLTDIEWVAYYNDFEVAKTVNEQLGGLHIGFSGGGGKLPFEPGSFHHGPAPYILHIHFNIMPRKLKAQFDQQQKLLKSIAGLALPYLRHFNPR